MIVCYQADVETDEVYAQMTLQPLSPVKVLIFIQQVYDAYDSVAR